MRRSVGDLRGLVSSARAPLRHRDRRGAKPGSRRLLWLSITIIGCSVAHTEPAPHTAASVATDIEAPPASLPVEAPARVRYDLAAHPERALTFDGDTAHLELGGMAGTQHTAGGWLSNVGETRTFADGAIEAAVTIRSRARLSVATEGTPVNVSVRVRGFRDGTAHLYWDGEELTQAEIGTAWTTLSAPLDARRAERGEHELMLRMDRGERAADGSRAYLALDWIRLGDASATDPRARPRWISFDGTPELEVPEGWTVAYPMEVMAGARLRGSVRGGRLTVSATREDGTVETLGAAAEGEAFDVDLGALANEMVQLSLVARGGPLRVTRPAVVTLDGDERSAVGRPRNVLVYLIDTLRTDRLRAYDPDTRVSTPSTSRFAEGAATFTAARAQENWTKPSVATLLSSLMPWEHTAFADASVVPGSVELLPELLEERGFETAGFVANGYVSDRFGFEQGFASFRNYIREGRRTRGEVVTEDVLQWLDRRRSSERPFFLYVHAIDPHVPYRPPERFLSMYDPLPYRGPVDFSRSATVLERIKTGALRLAERDRVHLEALYDGEVSYQDAQLGRLLEGLASRGLDDDTLVVITADHGEEMFDHGSVGHGHSLYDELLHVPLMIRVPGLAAQRVDEAVGLVDVAPTILDTLGQPIPEAFSGRSLLPMLQGELDDAPRATVAGFMEHHRSVAVGRFKLIARSGGRYQLYDLVTDPHEANDVAADRPMVLAYLRGLLGVRLSETAGSRPSASPASRARHRANDAVIDRELNEQLEALGYVGTSRRR